jgi:hypothetical protein
MNDTMSQPYAYESSILSGNPNIRTRPNIVSQGNIWCNISAIYTYTSSVPLGNTCISTFQNLISQWITYHYKLAAHAYRIFRAFWEFHYIHSKSKISQLIHSMSYFGHTWIHNALVLWGTSVLQALQTYAISWSLLDVITLSHMLTWHSRLLGNSCNSHTPLHVIL